MYSLDVFLSQFGTSLLFQTMDWFKLLFFDWFKLQTVLTVAS